MAETAPAPSPRLDQLGHWPDFFGRSVGRVSVTRLLGEGAMATVFRRWDRTNWPFHYGKSLFFNIRKTQNVQVILSHLLSESLVIGGWVAMWRPLETFLYDWWPLLGERRFYDRLSRMAVQIVYTGTQPVRQAAFSTESKGSTDFQVHDASVD